MTDTEVPLAAVVGHPVSHSLSPVIFAVLARECGRSLAYRKLDIEPAKLAGTVHALAQTGLFRGWNVTIPHKQAMARLCARLSPEARALGAVNVVRFGPRGPEGFNTDVEGVARALADQGFASRGARALIFGAGGAALAAGFALGRSGAREVWITNRTAERARAAVRTLRASAGRRTSFVSVSFARAPELEADLYVNATPFGMTGHPGGDPGFADFWRRLPLRRATPGGRPPLAFDLVYTPARTPFLAQAGRRGLRVLGGLDMLVWQAIATWEIWFGELGERRSRHLKRAAQRALLLHLKARERRVR